MGRNMHALTCERFRADLHPALDVSPRLGVTNRSIARGADTRLNTKQRVLRLFYADAVPAVGRSSAVLLYNLSRLDTIHSIREYVD